MKRILNVIGSLLIGGSLMLGLFGCGQTYQVDYDGRQAAYDNAKARYRAGAQVTLYYGMIATDTDYSFYLDGRRLNVDYSEEKGFVIAFTMPAHDVRLTCEARNSMEYRPETPQEPYLIAEYISGTTGTDGYDSRRSYALYSGDETALRLVVRGEAPDGAATETDYAVPYEAQLRLEALIDALQLREWKYLKDTECIDGAFSALRFRNDDGSYVRVSTDSMPADGVQKLGQVGALLAGYATAENQR